MDYIFGRRTGRVCIWSQAGRHSSGANTSGGTSTDTSTDTSAGFDSYATNCFAGSKRSAA
jgi:hypothetical protein